MKRFFAAIGVLFFSLAVSVTAFATPQAVTESYEKDGRKYIKKIYTLEKEEDILDVADGTFELNGFTYHQLDISNEPVVEVLKKEVEEKKRVSVSSQNSTAVLEKLGATREYTDEEGYTGTLEADAGSIAYAVSGYSTKTMTKSDNRRYYNLPSMDTSQIAKEIWSGGVCLKLVDIQWIGDNNFASGDTAAGNNFVAVGYYSGNYSVKIPNGYTATVTYRGIAEKEISEQIAYSITYLGEETAPPVEKKGFPIGPAIGGAMLSVGLLGAGAYFLSKAKRKSEADSDDWDLEEDMFEMDEEFETDTEDSTQDNAEDGTDQSEEYTEWDDDKYGEIQDEVEKV